MLYHIVSEASKFGQFRWSGFFPINKPELFSTESTSGIHFRTGTARKLYLSFPNRIFWNVSHKPHFHNAISHSVRSVKIRSIPMVWIFSLSTTELFPTESTRGIHPRTGTARKLHLFSPNRIFWNFPHKPHFRNAISHSVRHSIIGSVPMVWISFLSTNRIFVQRNQLGASTLGPELQRNSIYFLQIESSGTFLTSHISAMLYHIVSDTP